MKPHEPMLRYIRKNVERPDDLPKANEINRTHLRFIYQKCPMGLLPGAKIGAPFFRVHFKETLPKELSNYVIEFFLEWWEKETDPKLAVEAVWGKR